VNLVGYGKKLADRLLTRHHGCLAGWLDLAGQKAPAAWRLDVLNNILSVTVSSHHTTDSVEKQTSVSWLVTDG